MMNRTHDQAKLTNWSVGILRLLLVVMGLAFLASCASAAPRLVRSLYVFNHSATTVGDQSTIVLNSEGRRYPTDTDLPIFPMVLYLNGKAVLTNAEAAPSSIKIEPGTYDLMVVAKRTHKLSRKVTFLKGSVLYVDYPISGSGRFRYSDLPPENAVPVNNQQ